MNANFLTLWNLKMTNGNIQNTKTCSEPSIKVFVIALNVVVNVLKFTVNKID